MDRICSAVLEKICSLSDVGRYVVIAEDEFLECFPDGSEKNFAELKKALKTLINAGYIDLKYSSGVMYCVAPLKRFLPETDESEQKRAITTTAKKAISPFWSAFAGGALGSFFISLVFALIGYAR